MQPRKEFDSVFMEKLRATSTIRCYSKSMYLLHYGGTERGQFGACTLDLMHAFESGVVRDVCKAFIDPIPDRYKEQLDKFVDKIFSRQRCTGKTKCLRTNFSKGITNATLLTSNEWPGLLLVYLIVAQTYQGSAILDSGRYEKDDKAAKKSAAKRQRKRIAKDQRSGGLFKKRKSFVPNNMELDDEERCHFLNSDGEVNEDVTYDGPQCNSRDFIQLAEQLLAFHAYYSQSTKFWDEGDKNGKIELHKAMAVVLEQLTTTLCRVGNGWNTAKVHSTFRHVADLIGKYGSPTNTDAEVGERGLKDWAKKLAKITNKGSSADFLRQVTLRYFESLLFSRRMQAHVSSQNDTKNQIPEDTVKPAEPVGMRGKYKYVVNYEKRVRDVEEHVTGSVRSTVVIEKMPVTYSVFTTSEWCGRWNHKGVVELPSAIQEAFTNLCFPSDNDEKTLSATEVRGYTEYVNHKGTIFRAHPNYGNKGAWNDWSIIECPNDCVDLSRNPYPDDPDVSDLEPLEGEGSPIKQEEDEHHRSKVGDKKGKYKRTTDRPISWCEKNHGPRHVPAKILALYIDPETGLDMALVHACRPWMQKNYDRTSAITESWHLQYIHDEHLVNNPLPMRPFYSAIEASCLTDNIFLVEETPGLYKSLPCVEFTGHVIYIFDRKEFWPGIFL